jgi:hypothetical protein
MKVLLLLLCVGIAVSAAAQLTDGELKKITEKNKHLLQKAQFAEPILPRVLSVNAPGNVVPLKQDQMPCVVPDVKAITLIPNALTELTIPAIAAIPNPVFPKDRQTPAITPVPDSK